MILQFLNMLPAWMLADNAPPFQCAHAADCIESARIFVECNQNYCTCIWHSYFLLTITYFLGTSPMQCPHPIHWRMNKELYCRLCLICHVNNWSMREVQRKWVVVGNEIHLNSWIIYKSPQSPSRPSQPHLPCLLFMNVRRKAFETRRHCILRIDNIITHIYESKKST